MTTYALREPSVPAGATACLWDCDYPLELDAVRCLSWSRHDTGKVGVGVDGRQHVDGRVERFIALYPSAGCDLSAGDARALAAALLEAAAALDELR